MWQVIQNITGYKGRSRSICMRWAWLILYWSPWQRANCYIKSTSTATGTVRGHSRYKNKPNNKTKQKQQTKQHVPISHSMLLPRFSKCHCHRRMVPPVGPKTAIILPVPKKSASVKNKNKIASSTMKKSSWVNCTQLPFTTEHQPHHSKIIAFCAHSFWLALRSFSLNEWVTF